MNTYAERIAEQAEVGVLELDETPNEWRAEAIASLRDMIENGTEDTGCPWEDDVEKVYTGLIRSIIRPTRLQAVCDGRRRMLSEAK